MTYIFQNLIINFDDNNIKKKVTNYSISACKIWEIRKFNGTLNWVKKIKEDFLYQRKQSIILSVIVGYCE